MNFIKGIPLYGYDDWTNPVGNKERRNAVYEDIPHLIELIGNFNLLACSAHCTKNVNYGRMSLQSVEGW